MEGGGFMIEQRGPEGPNGWTVIGVGGLIGIALVIVALALFQMALWAGWALIIVAIGQAAFLTQRGAALIIEARGRARALEQEARTRWLATMRQRSLPAPGRRAREDMATLWPDGQRIDSG